jgi:methyl-accepting chemotaxis protein
MLNKLKNLGIRRQLLIIGIIPIIGLVIFGAMSFYAMNKIKVNGPIYRSIIQGKDVIADILPPPEYIIESYLVVLQAADETNRKSKKSLAGRFTELRKEYDARHEFWLKDLSEGDMKETLVNKSYKPAVAFYEKAEKEFFPAVLSGDKKAIKRLVPELDRLYESHRLAIDEVVKMANNRNVRDEAFAVKSIRDTVALLFVILLITVAVTIFVAFVISAAIVQQVGGNPGSIVETVKKVSEGDLTIAIEHSGNATGIYAAVSAMIDSLKKLVNTAKANSESIAIASSKLSAAVEQQASTASEQSAAVTEITSTMEELSASSSQIAEHSKSVVDIATETWENTKKGARGVETVLMKMSEINNDNQSNIAEIVALGKKSKEITKVMEIINTIADQTKLIAFNAALEASSAGEAGKRFGVVAVEIRRLADSVMESTGEIEGNINEIQEAIDRLVIASEKSSKGIQEGMEYSNETAGILSEIVDAAQGTTEAAKQISLSTQQQKTASNQVLTALREIVTASGQTTDAINQISNTCMDMAKMSFDIKEAVDGFKTDDKSNNIQKS